MKAVSVARKLILSIGLLFLTGVFLYLAKTVLLNSSNNIVIILAYMIYLLSAGVFLALKRKFDIPVWAVYVCLFALAFAYQFSLSSGVSFVGEGDLQFYYGNAANLAAGNNQLPMLYYATFPGTVTYPAVLAAFMRMFGISRAVPAMLNNLAVCALVCCVYAFLKQKLPSVWALAGGLAVALHPFMIIYSNTSNAELLFGVFMLLAFFAYNNACNAGSYKDKLIWTTAAAAACVISALFRPLGIIMVIAFILHSFVFSSDKWRIRLIQAALMIAVFSLSSLINGAIVRSITSYDPPKSSYGWNLYVGASPTGKWNDADGREFEEVLAASSSPDEVQDYFSAKAIDRYKEIGMGVIARGFRKLSPWLSYEYMANQVTMHGDDAKFVTKNSSGAVLAITALIDIPVMFLALAGAVWLLLKAFRGIYGRLLPLVFYLIGSFVVLSLLEIAPRYTVSYRMVFCVLAVEFIYDLMRMIRAKRAAGYAVSAAHGHDG